MYSLVQKPPAPSKETLNKFKENAFLKAKDFDIKKIVPLYEETYLEALSSIK